MSNPGQNTNHPSPDQLEDHGGTAGDLLALIEAFCGHLWAEAGLAENTLQAYRGDLHCLASFCQDRAITLKRITPLNIQEFLIDLREGKEMALSSISRRLVVVRLFLRFCFREGHLGRDVADLIEAPKRWRHLPHVLNVKQINLLLSLPADEDPLAERDRAILELFYATGLRVSELVGLQIGDVHMDLGYLRCIGKGRRERIVPIGSLAIAALRGYLQNLRAQMADGRATDHMFLSRTGRPIDRTNCWRLVVKYARRMGITGKLSPHTIRHCFATHILAGGADLRVVQELLGHADISSTQTYTHVDSSRLKSVHRQFHPRQ